MVVFGFIIVLTRDILKSLPPANLQIQDKKTQFGAGGAGITKLADSL
jgi:hypothetical protein